MKKSLLDLVAILLLAPVGLVLIAYSAMAAGRSSTIAVASTDLEEHRQRRWLSVRNRRRACRDGLCPARFDCYLMSGAREAKLCPNFDQCIVLASYPPGVFGG